MEMASFQHVALLLILFTSEIVANQRVKRIVGGRPAAVPPEDDPVVFVYLNDHEARVYGSREKPDGYYNFRGIRYGEPPVGRFRFQRARKLRLSGDINATLPGPPCPQPDPQNKDKITGSEDCLFLNVFTPTLPDSTEGLPVLMWIHGGGYRRGSASQYGVRHLVNEKLVVVTIQYRLGSLGFLSAGVKELPGNAGMFDMALALEWIKDYITFFGGNPNKITVFGQGTGASSAILLSLSQLTQGFLGGILAMSGSALSSFAIDHNPLATGRELAKQNGCPVTPVLEMVKCLQELPVSTLIQADSGFQELRLAAQGVLAGITGLLGAAPCIEGDNDGRFLPNFFQESPLDGLRNGKFPKIPLLTGVTRDETSSAVLGKYRTEILENVRNTPNFLNEFLNGIVRKSDLIGRLFNRTDELIQNVASKYFELFQGDSTSVMNKIVEATGDALFNLPAFQMAKMWSREVGKTFFYRFEQISKKIKHGGEEFLHGLPLVEDAKNPDIGGIGHGDDLPFVFDPESLYGVTSPSSFNLTDPDDQKVHNITTHLIAEFARTGEPKLLGEGKESPWPTFSEDKNDFVTISSNSHPQGNFRFCQMALWGGIFPRLQSATCEALWGITKFSEDALAIVDHALNQGVGRGAIINTVINNTVTGNVGGGAIINAVLNKTLPPSHNIQVGNGALINTVLEKTIPGHPGVNVGNEAAGRSGPVIGGGALINAFLNPETLQRAAETTLQPAVAPVHEQVNPEIESGDMSTINDKSFSDVDEEENLIAPVTESSIHTSTSKTDVMPTLLQLFANRPTLFPRLINRPTLFPRPALFQRHFG